MILVGKQPGEDSRRAKSNMPSRNSQAVFQLYTKDKATFIAIRDECKKNYYLVHGDCPTQSDLVQLALTELNESLKKKLKEVE
jgi:hypothetical protein